MSSEVLKPITVKSHELSKEENEQFEMLRHPTDKVQGVDTHFITGPDRHYKGGLVETYEFKVPPNRYILYVTYECLSGPCGWCYNPDGGYDIWVRYHDGRTRAEVKRLYDSHPVKTRYQVHWAEL